MSDEKIEKLIEMNRNLLLIIGYGTSLILELRHRMPNPDDPRLLWFIQAIENVVYQRKPLPELPL